ncbi:probable G-protein coupled receptor 101 isoform X1 [Brienomyrus brachyistius]|uniref:probable G-protein coupled receptor 101 isoform X1 n=2 Tax=Brienomyrus brachyistius TaxID=42636 RepID=UPI0020B2E340|nr:probable G-protein coupled receptor 101 isoform X1 [Brienomyrus brachyistius]XP_048883191.1 probable G-protein coupled receptor 101 isoform X1 [Brienomyrus brachyistius]XP_048883193.1 probable G-protein coupled receptor 101 isoform X1 [Brienomyrus brachyistius]
MLTGSLLPRGSSMSHSSPAGGGHNSSIGTWDPGTLSPSSTATSAVKMTLISAIMCTSLFGNVLVLLVFQRKPQLLHVANRFVLNLLLADLLQTVLVMPFAIAAALPGVWPLDSRLCQALVVLMHLFAFTGVNTIIVVSVDRYLAIIHPLSYPTRMTPHLGTNLIAATWLVSALQSTPPLYGWGAIGFDRRHGTCTVFWASSQSYAALLSTLSFWLPATIMLACYWMVFRAARRQNALVHPIHSAPPQDRHIAAATPQGPDTQQLTASPSLEGNHSRSRHRRFQYHCKAARVVFIITGSYVMSMGPYSILGSVLAHSHASVPSWLAALVLVLFFLQCCVHPYTYGYMHRSVRKEFTSLLCGPLICIRDGQRSHRGSGPTDIRSGHLHLPGVATRVCPQHIWEEGTVSSSPTERRSKDSRKETTSVSLISEK